MQVGRTYVISSSCPHGVASSELFEHFDRVLLVNFIDIFCLSPVDKGTVLVDGSLDVKLSCS